jgi:cupin fold WbuC family metalloprotein
MEIYKSKVDDSICHVINRLEDIKEKRIDLIDTDQFIQCATLNLKEGTTFRPHKHIWNEDPITRIAQESWVIIKGKVKCIFYDVDDTILATPILNAGDASFTLKGGHTYEILEDDTIVYEYKTGPYEGQKKDKVFFD